jgi:nucleotide-binding universal stress UspA family protein
MAQAMTTTPSYQKILVPHDGSEMSDRALMHASYLTKLSGAELVIIHVLEPDMIPPSALLAFIKPETGGLEGAKENLRSAFEGAAAKMLEERIKTVKAAGADKVSYVTKTGKPVDEIVNESESGDYDLVVMASSRIASTVRVLGSNSRRVIDSIRKPVLLVHE